MEKITKNTEGIADDANSRTELLLNLKDISYEDFLEKYNDLMYEKSKDFNVAMSILNFNDWIENNSEAINMWGDKLLEEFNESKSKLLEDEDGLVNSDLPCYDDVIIDAFQPGHQQVSFSGEFKRSFQLDSLKQSLQRQLRHFSIAIPNNNGTNARSTFGREVKGRKLTEVIELLKGEETFFEDEEIELSKKFNLLRDTLKKLREEKKVKVEEDN